MAGNTVGMDFIMLLVQSREIWSWVHGEEAPRAQMQRKSGFITLVGLFARHFQFGLDFVPIHVYAITLL